MTEAEPIGWAGVFHLVRWRDADLPVGIDVLVAEARETGVEWLAAFSKEWRQRPFLAEGEALFLARNDDRLAGMAVISADPHTEDPGVGRLRFIYVAREARGCGLLRAFVEACMARADGQWRRLRLHTDNPQAARVYESYGFGPASGEPGTTHVLDLQVPAAAASGA